MPFSAALVTWFFAVTLSMPQAAPDTCVPTIHAASNVEAITTYFRERGRTVLTFMGYSGAGYEDRAALLARAAEVLDRFDRARTIVNIGATPDGIGAVYELAKKKGFETAGIVSSQARVNKVPPAPCAGTVFFVDDPSWGGLTEGTSRLSPTSMAIVSVSDYVVAIGGDEVARDEFDAARRLGKKVEFFPADMNHAIALARAAKSKQPPPTDFQGALGAAIAARGK